MLFYASSGYSAVAMQPICGYMGPCNLNITNTAIIVSQNSGDELATWVFNCIRQFNAVDCYFSFTSGRRGPFGVGEYCFELPQKKVAEIQKKISDCTGAIFSQNRNYNNSTLSSSTNISNPSKPKAPVTNDNSRSRSESETVPSSLVSSNLYPLTTPPKSMSYQNTGIRRAIAPPLPSKDPIKPVVVLQDDIPNAKYVNAMKKNIPKPLPRTMKPSIKKRDTTDNVKPLVCPDGVNSTIASSLPHTNRSVTLPTNSQRSLAVTTSETIINPVGDRINLNKGPVDYGDMVCSPHDPDTHHQFFSPPLPPINSGYSDVDYNVIRRNREMGKFSDPEGVYSDTKDKKGIETYDVPSSLPITDDTYDVPQPAGRKFEDIPSVYEGDTKHPSPGDLYSVPTSNQQVSPDVYDVPPSRGKTVLQTYNASSTQDQIYDNPKSSSNVTNGDNLYDTPRFSQPVAEGHETYDVVPSQRAHSTSPQQQMATTRKKSPGYENIGPHGEILGEIVADQLRQDLLDSLNGGSNRQFLPRPLKSVNSNFSRSCEFLNGVVKEPSKRFSTSSTYKRVIMPDQDISQKGPLPTPLRHSRNFRRRLSGSLGDIPASVANDDDGTYVVLNKTEKPNKKPPIPAPKSATVTAARSTDRVEDNGESNDTYIVMNRSPSHSTSSSSIATIETLPKGYIRMNTAKAALVQKSYSSIEFVRKETSPMKNEGRRNSDLVWPGNSGWSSWNSPDDQGSRNSADTSEVFSPPPATHEHPIVVSKSAIRPKRSALLKGVSPQPVPGHEKRMGKSVMR